jgi:hypothetical protein
MIADWYKMYIQCCSKFEKKGLAVTNGITPQIIRTSFCSWASICSREQKSAPGSKNSAPESNNVKPFAEQLK